MTIAGRIIETAHRRGPDVTIGSAARPCLLRWHMTPRNRVLNIYLHCFKRSDDDRALHSHPWLFNLSILLRGRYREHTARGAADYRAGDFKVRMGPAFHRIELTDGDCWTLFITGPRLWGWGFKCPQGFVPWQQFTKELPGGVSEVGAGCGGGA